MKTKLQILLMGIVTLCNFSKADIYIQVNAINDDNHFCEVTGANLNDGSVSGTFSGYNDNAHGWAEAGGGSYYLITDGAANAWTTFGLSLAYFDPSAVSHGAVETYAYGQIYNPHDLMIVNITYPCLTNVTLFAANTRPLNVQFSTVETGTSQTWNTQIVPSGGTYYSTVNNIPCSEVGNFSITQTTNGVTQNFVYQPPPYSNTPSLYPDASAVATNLNLWSATNLAEVYTNNPIIWGQLNQDISGIIGASTQGTAGVISALGGNGTQAHSDATALDKQLVANSQQGTMDANGIISAVDKVRIQAHTDANANGGTAHSDANSINGSILGMSNLMANLGFDTNSDRETTQIGISNLMSQLANSTNNTFAEFSNNAAIYQSNAMALTPFFSMEAGLTNVVGNNGLTPIVSGIRSLPNNLGGGDALGSFPSVDIVVGPNLTLTIGGSSMPNELTTGKTVFSWTIYLGLFLYCWKRLHSVTSEALRTAQTTTAGESVLGTNLNVVSALTMAAIIVALTIVLITAAAANILPIIGNITGDPLASITGTFGYDMLNAVCPIGLVVSSIFCAVIFRVATDAGGVGVQMLIKFLTGL